MVHTNLGVGVPPGLNNWMREATMSAKTRALIDRIQALPAESISEVEDFVDFLATRSRRSAALDRLLAIAPALEAAGAPPIKEEDIAAEVDAMRAAQRTPLDHSGADRS
jgi:hypothetical protein